MATRKTTSNAKPRNQQLFINVPVSSETREGLHQLKEAMGADSQAEVIEKLVKMGVALQSALRN